MHNEAPHVLRIITSCNMSRLMLLFSHTKQHTAAEGSPENSNTLPQMTHHILKTE